MQARVYNADKFELVFESDRTMEGLLCFSPDNQYYLHAIRTMGRIFISKVTTKISILFYIWSYPSQFGDKEMSNNILLELAGGSLGHTADDVMVACYSPDGKNLVYGTEWGFQVFISFFIPVIMMEGGNAPYWIMAIFSYTTSRRRVQQK